MEHDVRTQAAVAAGHPEWVDLPATAKDAWAANVVHYFTGKRCKRDHVAPRFRSSRECVKCDRAYGKAPEQRDWFRSYRTPYEANRRSTKISATPSWLTADHHAAMRTIYDEAARLTDQTGIPHHVDHIVPLKHPDVCGLHLPWNLKVLTGSENNSKSNRFDGTMHNEGWRSLKGDLAF